MAAVYLHNALFSSGIEDVSRRQPHSRNDSIVSSTTLLPCPYDHSQPLLYPSTNEPLSLYDLSTSRPQPPHSTAVAPWQRSVKIFADPVDMREKANKRQTSYWRRIRKFSWWKRIFEGILVSWSVYNTTRYFYAFTVYDSPRGQTVSLVLGISTGVSFAFLACSVILSFFQLRLMAHHIPLRTILFAQALLQYLASFFLLGPAFVNLLFLFLWRNSDDQDVNPANRCKVDIDIIWSATNSLCPGNSPSWDIWLVLSIVRLILTLIVLIFYLFVAYKHNRKRRPSRAYRAKRHHRIDSSQSALPPMTDLSIPVIPPMSTNSDPRNLRKSSETTLTSHYNGSQSKPLAKRFRRSRSSNLSEDGGFIEQNRSENILNSNESGAVGLGEDEPDFGGEPDRFLHVINQIARETEAALEFAHSDSASGHSADRNTPTSFSQSETKEERHESEEDEEYDDMIMSSYPSAIGYNEFGQPYPPVEQVQMLNTFVRRMPTIESMGSREFGGSSVGVALSTTSSNSHWEWPVDNGRPSTRNTFVLSDHSGSEPSSRPTSLMAWTEMIVSMGAIGTSEIGELLNAAIRDGRRGGEEDRSVTTGSRSTGTDGESYYTATNESATGLENQGMRP